MVIVMDVIETHKPEKDLGRPSPYLHLTYFICVALLTCNDYCPRIPIIFLLLLLLLLLVIM
jgi:hypothetical protein